MLHVYCVQYVIHMVTVNGDGFLQQSAISNWLCVFCAVGNDCAARSKASVSGRSLGGTAGSNRAGGMDVCLL